MKEAVAIAENPIWSTFTQEPCFMIVQYDDESHAGEPFLQIQAIVN